jgi:hypothetical protein
MMFGRRLPVDHVTRRAGVIIDADDHHVVLVHRRLFLLAEAVTQADPEHARFAELCHLEAERLIKARSRSLSATQQGRAIGFIKAALYLAGPVGTVAAEPIDRAYGAAGTMAALALLSAAILALFLAKMALGRRAQPITHLGAPVLAEG